ncbi:MAG: T9SS type A sorting domain-containing protein [Saprospiraceae bacterium]|nr:T9SS type A sorting domain-containing protein [Saprospiraceae bacterium]
MSKLHDSLIPSRITLRSLNLIVFLCSVLISTSFIQAQCIVSPGTITGKVFKDQNLNGIMDPSEPGIPFIQVNAYDKDNNLAVSGLSAITGVYTLSGLTDANKYRIEVIKPLSFEYSFTGSNHLGELRFVNSPACENHFGLYKTKEVNLNPNPDIAVSIFNSTNALSSGTSLHSLVSLPQKFLSTSSINNISNNALTGSIFGLAWNRSKGQIYASAFVKQYGPIGPLGIGGIYAIQKNGQVDHFVNLTDMGVNLGSTNGINPNDCAIGSFVGKTGLGNMDISDDDQFLLVTNLYNKSIVIIPTSQPSAQNIIELSIPNPGCINGEYAVSAVKYHDGLVYLGVTCTGESAKGSMSFHVYELNLLSRVFNEILLTTFAKNYWLTNPGESKHVSQWLTDIDFNNRGEMILGIADRKGHTFCAGNEPLTNQDGDILVAYKSGNTWFLENGGIVNGRGGSGVGRYEGPGNGEFFGEDYWIVGPSLHPEVSFGTLASCNDAEVLNAVFDPRFESFAGGLHRYNTDNGKLISSIELYNRTNNQFGKASGIGDIEVLHAAIPLEIGNYIWFDQNTNGIQDADESGLEGVSLSLLDKNCRKVASVVTDIKGNYIFNNRNVDLNGDGIFESLLFDETYYIVLDDQRYNSETGKITILQKEMQITSPDLLSIGIPDSYDSDARLNSNICSRIGKYPVITVKTGNSGQNQFNFDIGLKPTSPVIEPPVPVYDLALIKKLASPINLKLNDFVEFEIEVYNQGTHAVHQYEITDYIPSQFEFVESQNPNWVKVGNTAVYASSNSIPASQKHSIKIKLKFINTQQISAIVNVAEISSMRNELGQIIKDRDSSPDNIKDNDAGGVVNSVHDNNINGNGTDDEDDHDPASIMIYDVALILTTDNHNPIKINEDRKFQIRVCNQGSEKIKNIKFIDYLPENLKVSPNDNNGWMIMEGKYYNIINEELLPGQCATKEILLRAPDFVGTTCIINRAEVISFENTQGISVSEFDIDSKADQINGNDAGGVVGSATDNFLQGNGINDEDDEDPEILRVADLALSKKLRENSFLKYKKNITFDIQVYNQGCIDLQNIQIVDYVPKGFSLSSEALNNGWSLSNDIATYVYKGVIRTGENISLSVELEHIGEFNSNSILNYTEIFKFEDLSGNILSDFDFDSSPDNLNNNDQGALYGSVTDNMILDHGVLDEDDHDVAYVPVVDIALTKTIVNPDRLVKENDQVEFILKVFNQGNQIINGFEIVDYLSDGFRYVQNENALWSLGGDKKLVLTDRNDLLPGESKSFSIFLRVNEGNYGNQIPNCAEIKSFGYNSTNLTMDFDSKQDDIPDNDKYDYSRVDDHGEIDEDDHDKAVTNPKNFDLYLRKFVNKRVVEILGDVTWTIEIINEGTITATELQIVDYLPEGLTMNDPDWSNKPGEGNSNKYYQTLSVANGKLGTDGLMPGETLSVKVVTRLNPQARPGVITNGAEIMYAKNQFNEKDEDSFPDDDESNDPGGTLFDGTDGTVSAGPDDDIDEDDADIEGVFYLVIEHSECVCLSNATTPGNGQFGVDLSLESRNDEVWFIRSVNGLFDPASLPPPAAPTPFIIGSAGFTLSPISFTGLTTVYGMSGVFLEGIGFDIVLENQYGDKVSLGNVRCSYDQPILIEAQNNVCSGNTTKYTLQNRAGSAYNWTLASGGVILSDPTKNSVVVQWTGATNSTHDLTVIESNPDFCIEPLTISVTIGSVPGPIACIGNAQISLDSKCEAKVTAKSLLVGGPFDYNSYAVMLINKDGTLVPNNIVTYEHVNKPPLTAKVINTCNGNICWSKITVEDKLAPVLQCLNDTIDCTRMKSHLGPLVFDNCDTKPSKFLVSETIENTPCNRLYSKIVHRKYQARDESGNLSKVCNSDYFLKRISLEDIVFPDSLTRAGDNSLQCGHYLKDSLGRPDPYFTGIPTYNGQNLWPNKDTKYCDFAVSFDDYVISSQNCSRKINRVWKVTIWYCTTFTQEVYNQYIEIFDNDAPVVDCPYDKEVFANSSACKAEVYIEPIKAIDSCNNGVSITLTYPGGIVKDFKGGFITLPVGENNIKVEAFDNCYNVSECKFTVNVVDKAAPLALCDRETVISLDRFGQAWIPATVFDDGSYDNCHLKSMKARRMDNGGICNTSSIQFADSVGFCCADLGQLVTVLFQVTDENGNSNTCMVQVEVQDKTIPSIQCPHDVTISCDTHIVVTNLSGFGRATASDNCDVTIEEVDSIHINQCREGYIERIFIAGNSFGLDVCTQKITIINNHPFTEADIEWPVDVDTTLCNADNLSVERLGDKYRPIITEDRCDLVGISHKDQVFRFVTGNDACFKIIRTWQVINWCRFKDPMTNEPIIYQHTQILKAHNKVAPTILEGCEEERFQSNDTSCVGANVLLFSSAQDDCTPDSDLINYYEIDLDSDGRIDHFSRNSGSRIDASGYYKLGKHRIKYVFEDKCGNKSVCEKNFEIINVKLPSAYCRKGLAVSLVPMDLNNDGNIDNEMATVWASDFDLGSSHPCGYDVTISIGRDSSIHSVTFDCKNVGRNIILLCATASNGTQDCCETFIDVQDNNNVDICGCIRQPNNLTVNLCNQLTDPVSLNSFPRFGACKCDSNRVTFNDVIETNIQGLCRRITRNWKVEFICQNANEVITFSQIIDVTTNLKEIDIQWPEDTVLVDNCIGTIDTSSIGETPRVCLYDGNVMIMFTDQELDPGNNVRVVRRTWNVFSKCVTSQSYFYQQLIIVKDAIGSKIKIPADITVNSCSKPFEPDSLNGYPTVQCGCDTINFDYKDDTIFSNNEVCYIVERNWIVNVRCRPTVDTTFIGIQRITRDVNLVSSDIIWPVDTFRSFTCQVNNNPNRTGRPTLRIDYCGLVSITSSDVIVNGATCNTIRRTWTVRNTCSNTQVFTRDQIIINFNQGTIGLTCPPNITVNADPNTCGARVNLNIPTVNSPCNFGISITNNAPTIFPVGNTNVIFTARDTCNHSTTCTTRVTIIENVPPTLTCPRDTIIECNTNLNNLNLFGTASVTDNCPGVSLRDSVLRAVNLCGIGTIRRFFIATDASGNRATCLQTITVTNNDPLDSLDIIWPQSPFTVAECGSTLPSNTGIPTIGQGIVSCFKVSVSFKDTSFCIPGNCQIDRKWTVLDSCTSTMFMFVQQIKINDTIPPTILGIKDTVIFANDTTCSGFINVNAFVNNCDSNTITITNNSTFGGNGMNDASGVYPEGTTVVKFTATDGCCNMSMKSISITVMDTIAPIFTCKKIHTDIQDNGCVTVKARDFLVVADDNCTMFSMLMFSFDQNNFNDSTRTICCDSLNSNGQYLKSIIIYVKDKSGNISFCETLLRVTDPNGFCGTFTQVGVTGIITNRKDIKMTNVPVDLISQTVLGTRTNAGGVYAFLDMPRGGRYSLAPSLDVDPLDGVSTYDIVLIQNHILGKKAFSSPYEYIAADVNNSKSVTSSDISEIRKLILGKQERFTKNNSWKFIPENFKFSDIENTLNEPIPAQFEIQALMDNLFVAFKGIKIGDINDSQKYTGFQSTKSRSNLITPLIVEDVELKPGEVKEVKIEFERFEDFMGAQATLFVSPEKAKISEVRIAENSSLQFEHVGEVNRDKGIINFSWIPTGKADKWQLILKLESKELCKSSEIVEIAHQYLESEAYHNDGSTYQFMIRRKSNTLKTDDVTILYQNIPNPFSENTIIPIEVSQATQKNLTIYDFTGKVISSMNLQLNKGMNYIPIERSLFIHDGVYLYKIEGELQNQVRKMVIRN